MSDERTVKTKAHFRLKKKEENYYYYAIKLCKKMEMKDVKITRKR